MSSEKVDSKEKDSSLSTKSSAKTASKKKSSSSSAKDANDSSTEDGSISAPEGMFASKVASSTKGAPATKVASTTKGAPATKDSSATEDAPDATEADSEFSLDLEEVSKQDNYEVVETPQTKYYHHTSSLSGLVQKGENVLNALSLAPTITWAITAGVLVVLIAVVIGIGVAISNSGAATKNAQDALSSSDNSGTAAPAVSLARASYKLNPTDFSQLSGSAEISGFSLAGTSASPQISEEHAAAITDALSAITQRNGEAGFVFVDTETGCGFSYNADHSVYGASSFKGPFAAYVCEHFVEAGLCSIDDLIPAIGESPWGYVSAGEDTVEELIAWSIIDSDNGSFGALREYFSGNNVSGITHNDNSEAMKQAFRTWLGGLGANTSIADDEEWFPFYTPRDAVRFWAAISNYIDSGTETSQFLADTLSGTETSFLRDALSSTGASVLDKAGWYDDDLTNASEYNSICDNGIVTIDGHKYLLCIMTSACYSDRNVTLVENLASAVFEARADLEAE